jgi:hypothetical protein
MLPPNLEPIILTPILPGRLIEQARDRAERGRPERGLRLPRIQVKPAVILAANTCLSARRRNADDSIPLEAGIFTSFPAPHQSLCLPRRLLHPIAGRYHCLMVLGPPPGGLTPPHLLGQIKGLIGGKGAASTSGRCTG